MYGTNPQLYYTAVVLGMTTDSFHLLFFSSFDITRKTNQNKLASRKNKIARTWREKTVIATGDDAARKSRKVHSNL